MTALAWLLFVLSVLVLLLVIPGVCIGLRQRRDLPADLAWVAQLRRMNREQRDEATS